MTKSRNCLSGLFWSSRSPEARHVPASPRQNAAQAIRPAEVATRGQREAKDIIYGDWQKLCFKAGGAPTLCRTSITGNFRPARRPCAWT